jgi:HAD superfamily hydrolase (TIGR01484 family)
VKVKAILSDYDGTLCPTASITHKKDQNRIPSALAQILREISLKMPLCIVSSKDLDFLTETISFSRVLSCIMGIETIVIEDHDATPARINPKFRRKLSADISVLCASSEALETLAIHFESESDFQGIAVERKRTSDGIVAGITIDWRNLDRWSDRKKAVEHTVGATLAGLQRVPSPLNLLVQKYSDHPFIDIYSAECNKGTGFDAVMIELSAEGISTKDVLYLGDSENDNPAFRKAGISIGIRSDRRINPELDCTHYLAFDGLAAFLAKLKENHFDFSPSLLTH